MITLVCPTIFLLSCIQVPIPWFQIMTSPSVWAIVVAHFCNNWGNYTLLTCIPSYFHDALNLTMGSVSIEGAVFEYFN